MSWPWIVVWLVVPALAGVATHIFIEVEASVSEQRARRACRTGWPSRFHLFSGWGR